MSCAKHQITESEWLDYIDGRLTGALLEHVREPMESCPQCRDIAASLETATRELQSAARATSENCAPDSASASRIWDGLRFMIRRAVTPRSATPSLALPQLRSILASMCGAATAEHALQNAARQSPHRDNEPFANNLGSMVGVMCGEQAGRLVRHAARMVELDRVA